MEAELEDLILNPSELPVGCVHTEADELQDAADHPSPVRLGLRIGNPANITPAHEERWERERQAIRAEQRRCKHVWHQHSWGYLVCGNCHAKNTMELQMELDF